MLIAVLFLILTAYSLITPAEVKKEVINQTLEQRVTFSHSVIPQRSILYPEPEPLTNQAGKYFIKIIDEFKVGIKADIVSNPKVPVEGTSTVDLKLRAREDDVDLWSRDYILSPEAKFEGTGTFPVIDDAFIVPLPAIQEFIKQVEEETGIRPRNGYLLDITPVIKTKATNKEITNDFNPSLSFSLSQNRIISQSKLQQENIVSLADTKVIPGYINILVCRVPVVYARYIFGGLTLLGLGAAVWLFGLYRRNKPFESEALTINRRYRSRIITAQNSLLNSELSVIHLQSFKELLKLADERDKSIISICEDGNNTCRYCVPDGKTLYCYLASNEAPERSDAPPRSSMNERVISETGSTV
ncbi:hypothetical protein SAMN05660649_02815 [Desulfotomaculum arcticum]|uniref:Uncharacterized protein n=1 Tax=Desulfotruncus arcticus DSM 17038 TaxID=1121424 RepID=A0A1I2UZL0_9FIRM|nr:DUF5305 family protein [Desulfotruncus arcticus]SFG82442.1 hypothetical protein SAMN05660649_02815 [Desulfotomaculum arcticum] [Desulfotruncus arcticus DSM 17038]